MKTLSIRFYEELNDFLPAKKKKVRYEVNFFGTPSIKDIIESQGVPHTEIDLILVNGKSVRFNYRIKDEDDISVYPIFESIDISQLQHLRNKPLRNPKFVLDVHLRTQARYIRMCGFDAKYENDFSDQQLIDISVTERRAILTRDIGILKNGKVIRGYFVRNTKPVNQIFEIVNRFDLKNLIDEFTRCINCNNKLKHIPKEKLMMQLPPKVKTNYNDFLYCNKCRKIYWKGSHFIKMNYLVEEIKSS